MGRSIGANLPDRRCDALNHLHADSREFVLHLDLDVIAQEEFPPVVVPGSGGLSFEDVRAALKEILRHKYLVGLNIAQYNPDKDPGGGAKKIVDLLVESLSARIETPAASSTEPTAQPEESSAGTTA